MTPPRRRLAAALMAAFAVLILGGVLPSPVMAHAELVSSTPADGAELASPPREVRLVLSEAPKPDTVSVRLFDRRGTGVPLGQLASRPYPTTILIPIPSDLTSGPYTVVWSVVSSADEHPAAGEFVFGVGEPAAAPSVTAETLSPGGGPLIALAALLAFVGLALMLGAAFQARVLGLVGGRVMAVAIAGGLLLVCAMVTAAAAAPRAAATITEASPGLFRGADPVDLARATLLLTFFGAIYTARFTEETGRRRAWLLAFAVAAALAWLQASKSHAAGVGILPWVGVAWQAIDTAIADPGRYAWFGTAFEAARQLNVLVTTAHTIAVGVWIGGLIVAALYRFGPDELAGWHPRFSRVAFRAFLVVAATGLFQAVLYLPAPDALVTSDYGRILVAKHVFVAGVLALAALNRFVAGPALRRAAELGVPARRAIRTIRVEALVGVAVLSVTGFLATTPPARPATSIFVRPDLVAQLANPEVQVVADRGGAILTVSPLSATQQRFSLSAPGLELAPSAALTISSPDGKIERQLPLLGGGSGWAAEGLAFPRDGVWVVSAPLTDGGHVSFRVEVAFGRVASRDDAARQVWDRAINRSETGMRSARMIDQLTDGLSVMLFGYHEFVAPDRERFDIQGRFSSINVAGERFTREAGADTWTITQTGSLGATPLGSTGGPNSWPWFGFLRAAVGVTVEGQASQAGQRCQVLVGVDPQSDVTYEIWVGTDDGMIHRLVMGLPGHYMVNAYFDVNAPIDIEPPAGPVAPAAAGPSAHHVPD